MHHRARGDVKGENDGAVNIILNLPEWTLGPGHKYVYQFALKFLCANLWKSCLINVSFSGHGPGDEVDSG